MTDNTKSFESEVTSLLLSIAKALVDSQADIEVAATSEGRTTLFTLRSRKEDLGKLIGRQGRTATAMRVILGAVASKHGRKAVLGVEE
jgi:hypothetical protein